MQIYCNAKGRRRWSPADPRSGKGTIDIKDVNGETTGGFPNGGSGGQGDLVDDPTLANRNYIAKKFIGKSALRGTDRGKLLIFLRGNAQALDAQAIQYIQNAHNIFKRYKAVYFDDDRYRRVAPGSSYKLSFEFL